MSDIGVVKGDKFNIFCMQMCGLGILVFYRIGHNVVTLMYHPLLHPSNPFLIFVLPLTRYSSFMSKRFKYVCCVFPVHVCSQCSFWKLFFLFSVAFDSFYSPAYYAAMRRRSLFEASCSSLHLLFLWHI